MFKLNHLTINSKSGFLKNFSIYNSINFKFSQILGVIDLNNSFAFTPVTVNTIRDNIGARKEKKRLGRGPGTGKGKTSGRGHKGYKARNGNPRRWMEGGSTPLTRRFPKFGTRDQNILDYNYINLFKLAYYINKKKIDPSKPITIRELFWSGAISRVKEGVKVLARGAECLDDLPPLHLEVTQASKGVIDAVKKHGGTVKVVYKNRLTLRALTKPWKFISPPRDPIPPFRKVVKLLKEEEKGAE